jgi:ABC-type glycerol-3-phosphate transport system substrate-binding protein
MKKVIANLFVVALMVLLAACSGGKKEVSSTVEPAKTENTAATAESTAEKEAIPQEENPAETLKAFEAYAKEFAEAHNNVLKDPQKYQKLARQAQEKIADLERIKVQFDKNQEAAYKKSLDIVMKVLKGGK